MLLKMENKLTKAWLELALYREGKTINMDTQTQTLGESRVRLSFNPSDDSLVDYFKKSTAILIDALETMKDKSDPEKIRLISLAQTHYEDAAMWSVKAATIQK
jgi:hypothetical protein